MQEPARPGQSVKHQDCSHRLENLGRVSLKSGLTQACLSSPHSRADVTKTVLEYIKKWIPQQGIGVLAGSSVHADRAFLAEEMPEIIDWLHYRCVIELDVHQDGGKC